jgi:hypothetical protein
VYLVSCIFQIRNGMQDPSRFRGCLNWGIAITTAFYVMFGVLGELLYVAGTGGIQQVRRSRGGGVCSGGTFGRHPQLPLPCCWCVAGPLVGLADPAADS